MKRTIQKHALVAALWSLAFTVLPVHAADDAAQLQQGKVLFGQGAVPACALCHALKDAGAEGAVGPSLDELKPDAKRVAYVREHVMRGVDQRGHRAAQRHWADAVLQRQTQ